MRYIHAREYYAAECGSFAGAIWKDVTNTLLSRQQCALQLPFVGAQVKSTVNLRPPPQQEVDGDWDGAKRLFSPSMLPDCEFCLLETHIYIIINCKRQGLGRQAFSVKYSHGQAVKPAAGPPSAVGGQSEQKFWKRPSLGLQKHVLGLPLLRGLPLGHLSGGGPAGPNR